MLTIWKVLLLVCLLFVHSNSVEILGCHFEDENYNINVPNYLDSVYRNVSLSPLIITNLKSEIETIVNTIASIISEVNANNLYNTLEDFLILFNDYKATEAKTPLNTFIQSYKPRYRPYETSKGFIIEILKKLGEQMPKIKGHMFPIAVNLDVQDEFKTKIIEKVPPPVYFAENSVAAAILFRYGKRNGFFIIDPEMLKNKVAIIMYDEKNPHIDNFDIIMNNNSKENYKYKLLDNGYFIGQTFSQKNKSIPTTQNLYYKSWPYCSFQHTTTLLNLILPIKYISKSNKEGFPIYIMVFNFGNKVNEFSIYHYEEGSPKKIVEQHFDKIHLIINNKYKMEYVNKVLVEFNWTITHFEHITKLVHEIYLDQTYLSNFKVLTSDMIKKKYPGKLKSTFNKIKSYIGGKAIQLITCGIKKPAIDDDEDDEF